MGLQPGTNIRSRMRRRVSRTTCRSRARYCRVSTFRHRKQSAPVAGRCTPRPCPRPPPARPRDSSVRSDSSHAPGRHARSHASRKVLLSRESTAAQCGAPCSKSLGRSIRFAMTQYLKDAAKDTPAALIHNSEPLRATGELGKGARFQRVPGDAPLGSKTWGSYRLWTSASIQGSRRGRWQSRRGWINLGVDKTA